MLRDLEKTWLRRRPWWRCCTFANIAWRKSTLFSFVYPMPSNCCSTVPLVGRVTTNAKFLIFFWFLRERRDNFVPRRWAHFRIGSIQTFQSSLFWSTSHPRWKWLNQCDPGNRYSLNDKQTELYTRQRHLRSTIAVMSSWKKPRIEWFARKWLNWTIDETRRHI